MQSKSVTPVLAGLAEEELTENSAWSIPNRRNEGKKEPMEAQTVIC